MASYGSYKKIISGQIIDGTVPNLALEANAGLAYNVKYVYGQPQVCSPGCCCLWTVPTGVRSLYIAAWGAGGNGSQHSNRGARGREGVVVVHEFYG